MDEICRATHRQGGVVIAAHPWAEIIGLGDAIFSSAIDAVEVGNCRYQHTGEYRRFQKAFRKMTLRTIASSDGHSGWEVGGFCVESREPLLTGVDLICAIRQGALTPRFKSPPGKILQWLRAER